LIYKIKKHFSLRYRRKQSMSKQSMSTLRPSLLSVLFARFLRQTTCISLSHARYTCIITVRPSPYSFFRAPLTANFVRESLIIHAHARLPWIRHAAINPDLSFHDKLTCPFVCRCNIYAVGMIITFLFSFASPICDYGDFPKGRTCFSFDTVQGM